MRKLSIDLWNNLICRLIYLCVSSLLIHLLLSSGKEYYGLGLLFSNYRLLNNRHNLKRINFIDVVILKYYEKILEFRIQRYAKGNNQLYLSFLKSKKARSYRDYFLKQDKDYQVSLKYPRQNDFVQRQGDLMILKPFLPENREKGVIIIHYTESIAKFAALYDLIQISQRYRIVFEPSWWGYQNVDFFLFLFLPTEIIIESPYELDYEFIKKVGHNFYPIRMGAGDWVDPEIFTDGKNAQKKYDIVMVGNWSKIKRHEVLFKAINEMPNRNAIRTALVGYPSDGRTKRHILREAERFGVEGNVIIFENIKPEEVARVLRESKVNVLLSVGEGANRGIYEGLFSGNVLVLYRNNKGVNKEIINEQTGYLADENELSKVLRKAINNYYGFNTSKWAKENCGYLNSTVKLNESIKNISKENSENWTVDIVPKVNKPNGLYAFDKDRVKLQQEYLELRKYIVTDR